MRMILKYGTEYIIILKECTQLSPLSRRVIQSVVNAALYLKIACTYLVSLDEFICELHTSHCGRIKNRNYQPVQPCVRWTKDQPKTRSIKSVNKKLRSTSTAPSWFSDSIESEVYIYQRLSCYWSCKKTVMI